MRVNSAPERTIVRSGAFSFIIQRKGRKGGMKVVIGETTRADPKLLNDLLRRALGEPRAGKAVEKPPQL